MLLRFRSFLSLIEMVAARSTLIFFINHLRYEISGTWAFRPLAHFLREHQGLTGTKIVCGEGDCGACTVLIGNGQDPYRTINSCILPLYLVDGHHLITIEGLAQGKKLHPAQEAIVEHFGTQCGYCTPGVVQSMAVLVEESLRCCSPISSEQAKQEMAGNLCRCTGYQTILAAATQLDLKNYQGLRAQFADRNRDQELARLAATPIVLEFAGSRLDIPASVPEALDLKEKYPKAKVVAGATDVGVELNKRRELATHFISLQKLDLKFIRKEDSWIEIGATVTLTGLQNFSRVEFPELAKALEVFGAPQIRNSATLIGNLVNASPIGDTIPLLLIAEGELLVQSRQQRRTISLCDFYIDYKRVDLRDNEIVTALRFPIPKATAIYKFYKVSARKDLDISIVNLAAMVELQQNQIVEARVAFGGVGPKVLRIYELEKKWKAAHFERRLFEEAGGALSQMLNPISDLRGSSAFRLKLCQNLLLKFFDEISGDLP